MFKICVEKYLACLQLLRLHHIWLNFFQRWMQSLILHRIWIHLYSANLMKYGFLSLRII